jgi:hypothetical protein
MEHQVARLDPTQQRQLTELRQVVGHHAPPIVDDADDEDALDLGPVCKVCRQVGYPADRFNLAKFNEYIRWAKRTRRLPIVDAACHAYEVLRDTDLFSATAKDIDATREDVIFHAMSHINAVEIVLDEMMSYNRPLLANQMSLLPADTHPSGAIVFDDKQFNKYKDLQKLQMQLLRLIQQNEIHEINMARSAAAAIANGGDSNSAVGSGGVMGGSNERGTHVAPY